MSKTKKRAAPEPLTYLDEMLVYMAIRYAAGRRTGASLLAAELIKAGYVERMDEHQRKMTVRDLERQVCDHRCSREAAFKKWQGTCSPRDPFGDAGWWHLLALCDEQKRVTLTCRHDDGRVEEIVAYPVSFDGKTIERYIAIDDARKRPGYHGYIRDECIIAIDGEPVAEATA